MLEAIAENMIAPAKVSTIFEGYDDLVDIRNVKLRDGATRLDNALYFLEQIKNPHKFRVGNDIVEICCVGEESLSDVLAKHFSRKAHA